MQIQAFFNVHSNIFKLKTSERANLIQINPKVHPSSREKPKTGDRSRSDKNGEEPETIPISQPNVSISE
jgi:hypothetical protein